MTTTIKISARGFLESIFDDAPPGTHTVITTFRCDPSKADRSDWAGRPWRPGETVPSAYSGGNSYLTVSAFQPDPQTGECRRRKANFASMHAVMVDDVGTKVEFAKLSLRPSVLVETSPGNYQAYYILKQDEQTRERDACERLVNRMVAAGLTADSCDPGMKGVTRYGRLPVGVNSKAKYIAQTGRPFPVRCTSFEPTRRYYIAEIAGAWKLDMRPDRPRAPVIQLSVIQAARAADNFGALLRTLELMGMYRQRNPAGWHDIRCPWVHEHTDFAETGTAIAEPSSENIFAGGFKCHHGHCEGRGMREVWAWARALDSMLRRQQL